MKDATLAGRLERVVATLEVIVGRLDSVTAQLAAALPPRTGPDEPSLSIEDQIKAIDDYTKARHEELQDENLERAREYSLGD